MSRDLRRWSAMGWCCVCIAPALAAAQVSTEIVLCLDVSPSIDQQELDTEIAGLKSCLGNTDIIPHDGTVAVGVVIYGDVATDILGLTPVTPANLMNVIEPALDGIMRDLDAQTNIGDGLIHARNMLDGADSETDNDYILLSGDGAANIGPDPDDECPATGQAGITICSIAVGASQSGQNELQGCALDTDGQFGVAPTFNDFEPVCLACVAFFLDVICEGPTACNDPGTCAATIACEDIVDCEGPPMLPITQDCDPPGPYPLGTTGVSVTCASGNRLIEQSTCNVTVTDCEPPTIACPPPRNLACDQSTLPAATGSATATDNCDGAPAITFSDTIQPGACAQNRVITRRWKATDASGLEDGCDQIITVSDGAAPIPACPPAEITVPCSQPLPPFNPSFTDNCDATPATQFGGNTLPGTCASQSDVVRSVTAMDDCGNTASCTQTAHIVDLVAPTISCPGAIVLTCAQMEGVPIGNVPLSASAGDNCNGNLIVTDDRPDAFYSPTCGLTEPNVVTFTVSDGCNPPVSCSVPIFVTGVACCPSFLENDTDLTLLLTDIDLRQETGGPVATKANFDVWNSNEVRFSGTERCVTCWDQTLLGAYALPNHFILGTLQTDKGKARIDGIDSSVCPESRETPLLGVAIKELTAVGLGSVTMRAATPLTGIGAQSAQILYDSPSTPEAQGPTDPLTPAGLGVGALTIPPTLNSPMAGFVENRASITEKGSLLFWVKIELKWDAAGRLIQDTFVTLLNDHLSDVTVKLYQVNGDAPLPPVIVNGQLIERAHPGWNNSDLELVLTGNESAYWSAATGAPKGVSPFWVLDGGNPPGRPDLDPSNPGGRVVRGFMVAWAINEDSHEVRWNHLKGAGIVVHYADTTAWEYDTWSYQCVSSAATGEECDGVSGQLLMDGIEYDVGPDRLLLDFFATGSRAMSPPGAQ